MDFNTFISKYKDDAIRFDLQKELPLVYNKLQEQIIKLQSAEFESEIKEVIEFSEKAIKDCKKMIITTIINKNYKAKFTNCTPSYIEYLRGYLDYSELNKKANNKLSNIQPQQQLKDITERKPITKQMSGYNRVTRNYVYTEKEKRYNYLTREKTQLELYYKNRTEDNNGNYIITRNKEIDNKINLAIKRDYNFFNENSNNYREVRFDNFGFVEVFKIGNIEYLIESYETERHTFHISIYNYGYAEKWLKHLDNLLSNYNCISLREVKETIIEDAKKKGINNIEKIADITNNLFFHCLDFHNNQTFDGIGWDTERVKLFRYINVSGGIFWWKQKKDREINNCINNLITELEELFISVDLKDFIQIRDFIILWIGKIIDITINNETKMFQWAYSPFMDIIFNLSDKIKSLFSDERISLKNSISNAYNDTSQLKPKESYPENKYWFIVGLKLATGELQKIYEKKNKNATQTAIGLGNINLRPYISESISNTNSNDKNIFSRKQKDLDLIITYCKENDLNICDDFKIKYQINTIK